MNLGYFISRRIYKKGGYGRHISSPILKIAVGAVALGMVVMLVAVSTGLGLQKTIQSNVAAFSGHVQIMAMDTNESYSSAPISIAQDFYPQFTSVPQVKHIQVFATRPGILLKTDDEFEGVVLKGVSSDYLWDNFRSFIKSGSIPGFGIHEDAGDSIIVSQKTADALKADIGDRVKMYFVRDSGKPIMRYFTIAATFKTGIPDFDDNYAIGSLDMLQNINQWTPDMVGGFEVILENTSQLPEATRKIYLETGWELGISSIASTHAALLDWVAMFDVNIAVILGIMIIVCGVNMITVLLILILEKTSLIGLLKSLGASNHLVRKVFLWNAFYIILQGLFWGNLIALALLFAQKYTGFITLDSSTYSVDTVPVYLDVWVILALNAGAAFINMTMLIVPSYFISRIKPAETLKYE